MQQHFGCLEMEMPGPMFSVLAHGSIAFETDLRRLQIKNLANNKNCPNYILVNRHCYCYVLCPNTSARVCFVSHGCAT